MIEATGSPKAAAAIFEPLCPGGRVVLIGGQSGPIAYDAGAAMVREARVENIFRYAHVFPRCVAMLSSGAIDVKPLITDTFAFDQSVAAFEFAAAMPPTSAAASSVKIRSGHSDAIVILDVVSRVPLGAAAGAIAVASG